MKKKSLIVLIVLLLTCCLTGCVTARDYYDDTAQIIKHMDNRTTFSSVTNNTEDKFSLSASLFDGCMKLKLLDVTENAVLDVSLSLESGRMKLVAIPEGSETVIVVAEVTEDAPSVAAPIQSTLTAGEYRFVLVADYAHEVEVVFNY